MREPQSVAVPVTLARKVFAIGAVEGGNVLALRVGLAICSRKGPLGRFRLFLFLSAAAYVLGLAALVSHFRGSRRLLPVE